MNALRIARLQLLGFYGLNKTIHRGSSGEKLKLIAMGVLYLLLGLMFAAYAGFFAFGVSYLGLGEAVPLMMMTLCTIIILFFSFMKSSGVIFGAKDYDFLMSLPLSPREIVAGRILSVYLGNLPISFIALAPSMLIYGIMNDGGFGVFIYTIFGILLTPVVPLGIALGFGALVAAISTRFRHRNIAALILSSLGMVVVLILSFSLNSINSGAAATAAVEVGMAVMGKMYPPAVLFTAAVTEGKIGAFLLYLLVNLVVGGGLIALIARYYKSITSAIASGRTGGRYDAKAVRSSSVLKALIAREAKVFVGSTTYAINAGFGVVLMVISAVALCFVNINSLLAAYEVPASVDVTPYIAGFLPLVLALFAGMTTTASVSLTMEGSKRWIIFSLPLKSSQIFGAKIAFNVLLLLPAILLSGIILAVKFGVTGWNLVFLFLLPTAIGIFTATLGLALNLAFPKYDWNTEQQAVKQSFSPFLTVMIMLVLMTLIIVAAVFFTVTGSGLALFEGIVCLAFLVLSGAIFLLIKEKRLYM